MRLNNNYVFFSGSGQALLNNDQRVYWGRVREEGWDAGISAEVKGGQHTSSGLPACVLTAGRRASGIIMLSHITFFMLVG